MGYTYHMSEKRVVEIGGLTIANVDAEQETILRKREAFVEAYVKEQGWDRDNLDLTQVMEIRKQPEWKDPA